MFRLRKESFFLGRKNYFPSSKLKASCSRKLSFAIHILSKGQFQRWVAITFLDELQLSKSSFRQIQRILTSTKSPCQTFARSWLLLNLPIEDKFSTIKETLQNVPESLKEVKINHVKSSIESSFISWQNLETFSRQVLKRFDSPVIHSF